MQCDRCLTTTQDLAEMGSYRRLTGMYERGGPGATESWDLCPPCWDLFEAWVAYGTLAAKDIRYS